MWSVHGVSSTTKYWKSPVSLAVVVDWTFTSGGVDVWTRIDHCCISYCFFPHVKLSQLVPTAKLLIFPIYDKIIQLLHVPTHQISVTGLRYTDLVPTPLFCYILTIAHGQVLHWPKSMCYSNNCPWALNSFFDLEGMWRGLQTSIVFLWSS